MPAPADEPTNRNPDIVVRVEGRLGRITLNRPERINALTLDMIMAVRAALDEWVGDPRVALILIDGAGERGLCAGADVRLLYDGIRGEDVPPMTFWGDEYRMNSALSHFPKPVVAYMHGITLGGGVGISAHGSVRIVTETSQVGMPETAIGLCPDVGGLYLLSRAPGELGTHAALAGARLGPADAIEAGLADWFVPSNELAAVTQGLRRGVVGDLGNHRPPPGLPADQRRWIDQCYPGDDVEAIIQRLRRHPEAAARQTAQSLQSMAPTALEVTLMAIRRASSMTLDEVLDQDLRVSSRFMDHPDMSEGIRAALVDRDRTPRWSPARLDELDRAHLESFFAPLDPSQELGLSRRSG